MDLKISRYSSKSILKGEIILYMFFAFLESQISIYRDIKKYLKNILQKFYCKNASI